MSDQGTSVACCGCCGMPIASPLPGATTVAGSGTPVPPADPSIPDPPAQAIATWPVRIPLADGSYVWLPVPWPASSAATTTSVPTPTPTTTQPEAGPTTEPIGHDASRPPATA